MHKAEPWRVVKERANRNGVTIHLGSLLELCYLKGSELHVDDPGRKYKGRVVFLGDRVKDQHGATAVFEELSSSPCGDRGQQVLRCLWLPTW